jgi:hypothetical protein
MSTTFTYSDTFTRTHARYIGSKVAADLRQMRAFYFRPDETEIDDYLEELVELLAGGYLESVDYGFRRDDGWVVALNYVVRGDGTLDIDDRSGRVPPGSNVADASWYSYLRYSQKWHLLSSEERQAIKARIPVKRTDANEPNIGAGNVWIGDKVYSSNGTSISRRTMCAGG